MLNPDFEQATLAARIPDVVTPVVMEAVSPLTQANFISSGNEELDIRRKDEMQSLMAKGFEAERLATLVRLNQGEITVQATREKLESPTKAMWKGYLSALTFGSLLTGGLMITTGFSRESIVTSILTLMVCNGVGGWVGSMMSRNASKLRRLVPDLLDDPLRKAYQVAQQIRSEVKAEKLGSEAAESLFDLRLKEAANDIDCEAQAYLESASEIGRGSL